MKLAHLIDALPGARLIGGVGADVEIRAVHEDSRQVGAGDVFVAVKGLTVDGHAYVEAAIKQGAAAVVVETEMMDVAAQGTAIVVVPSTMAALGVLVGRSFGEPAKALTLIGVTGTNGKTTTTFLLDDALRRAGRRCGLVGTVETRILDQRLPSVRTTPEAPDLQALLAQMVAQGADTCSMEVSSHALALGRVDGTRYDVAIFTNLSQDHLDFHDTLEDYFAAKAQLFTARYAAAGVVNLDDPRGRQLAAMAQIPITTFSAEGRLDADWRAADIRTGADGSTFRVIGPGGVAADAAAALPGRFNVANALGAIVGLVEAGIGLAAAVSGVAACPGVPGRLERVEAGQDFTVLVDYSHKPGAVEAVLAALRQVTLGNLTIVLGCGGDRDAAKRPLMGAAAARLADTAIFTSDNPRSEDPLAILTQMLGGAVDVPPADRAEVLVVPDRGAAIEAAIAAAGKGDVVLIAGKGHETGQYLGGAAIEFDDRVVAGEALARRRRAADGTMSGVRTSPVPLRGDAGPEPAAADPRTVDASAVDTEDL
jgi:UDP-N-acetylmuramoyl-L-alanyl-D-glutamate--2,6-diaminopimelate ligase